MLDARGDGIVSCYNTRPKRDGAATLTLVNLLEVARRVRKAAGFPAKLGPAGRYGHNDAENALGYEIPEPLAELVAAQPLHNAWRVQAMAHSKAGLPTETGRTYGVRVKYGQEPDPFGLMRALTLHQQYCAL